MLDPTGARARMLLATRAAPVALGGFLGSMLVYLALVPLAPAYEPLGAAATLALALGLAGLAAGSAELTFQRAPRTTSFLATLGVLAAVAAAALAAARVGGAGDAVLQGMGWAFGGVGAWLAASSGLALAQGALPRGVAAAGVLAGASFLLAAAAGDPAANPTVGAVVGVLALAGFPLWTLGLRRALWGAASAASSGASSPS